MKGIVQPLRTILSQGKFRILRRQACKLLQVGKKYYLLEAFEACGNICSKGETKLRRKGRDMPVNAQCSNPMCPCRLSLLECGILCLKSHNGIRLPMKLYNISHRQDQAAKPENLPEDLLGPVANLL